MVEGARVKQAREFCGLTQTELARRVTVSQPAIAQIEARQTQPSSAVVEAIAFQTGFPLAFFQRAAFQNFPLGSLVFRAKRSMTAKERSQAYRHGEVIYEAVARLSARIELGPLRVPRLDRGDFDSPAEAAIMTRAALGLSPDAPISNLVNALEWAGVFVIQLPLKSEHADAYSLWADSRPVVVVFHGAPGDRLRMSLAHELGHLVMHQQLVGDEKEREQEAFAFAGEFLMPDQAAHTELLPPVTLSTLALLKPRWGMAISALIMRASRLNIITPRQQKYLFQQLSQRGWRKREPSNLDLPVEKPRAARKIIELLYGDPPDIKRVASDLSLPADLIKTIVAEGATLAELPRVRNSHRIVASADESAPAEVVDLAVRRRRPQRT